MRDPYVYENSRVLKNKLNIRTQNELDDAEEDFVSYYIHSEKGIHGQQLRFAVNMQVKLG